MLSLQARETIRHLLSPVIVPIHDAFDKAPVEDIRAHDPLPPYRTSLKDGYAVVASDGPGEYPIITESRAGNDGIGVTVSTGTVAYVMAGGPIPYGADAVVQEEDTEIIRSDSDGWRRVKILAKTSPGVNIHSVNSLRTRRNRTDSLVRKPRYLYSDPPWVAKQLDFTIVRQKDKVIDLTRKIKHTLRKGLFWEAENFTLELSVMINADPRLGDLLRKNFIKLLIHLLKHEKHPKLQVHAATILQTLVICPSNEDVIVAIEYITPVVVELVSSREYLVRLQALRLLRNLIFIIPKSILKPILEEALVPVISYIVDDSTGYVVLEASADTLLYSCQEYPNFSPELLKLALPALVKLIKFDDLPLVTSASRGLAHLCDGREEMVVEDEYLDSLIERLLDLINAEGRIMIISGLDLLGSIVRWGSDKAIEAIIKKEDTLASLMCLFEEDVMYYVKQACWIISNITARKEEHIKAVIDSKLIDPLFNVVQNHKFVVVRKEALWAISNAMCGVGPDQIECLRDSCSKVLWDKLLQSLGGDFVDDRRLVLVTFEGLTNMKLL